MAEWYFASKQNREPVPRQTFATAKCLVEGEIPGGPAKKEPCKRSSFLRAQARAGRVRPGLENLASIFCDFLKQHIRKVY